MEALMARREPWLSVRETADHLQGRGGDDNCSDQIRDTDWVSQLV